jgi:SAM-dependent methyltransferase
MIITGKSVDDVIQEEGIDSSQLTFQDGIIPLFGEHSDFMLKSFRYWTNQYLIKHGAFRRIQEMSEEYYPKEVESLVMFGALAFAFRKSLGDEVDNVYDLGCGFGISVLTYALLGGTKGVGVDLDEGVLQNSRILANDLKVSEFRRHEGGFFLDNVTKPNDLVIARGLEPQLRHTYFRKLGEKLKFGLFCEPLDLEDEERFPLIFGRDTIIQRVSFPYGAREDLVAYLVTR